MILVYPEFNWDPYLRNRVPKSYWNKPENIRTFMDRLKEQFNIQSIEDWYRVSVRQIISKGGGGLLQIYNNSLISIFTIAYPEIKWNETKFKTKDKRSAQRLLYNQIQELYPNNEVVEDYFHEELSRLSGHTIQFDIYIPTLKLGFEYHGEQHFKDLPVYGSIEMYQQRDNEKEKICKEHNITLITIPHHCNLQHIKHKLPSFSNK